MLGDKNINVGCENNIAYALDYKGDEDDKQAIGKFISRKLTTPVSDVTINKEKNGSMDGTITCKLNGETISVNIFLPEGMITETLDNKKKDIKRLLNGTSHPSQKNAIKLWNNVKTLGDFIACWYYFGEIDDDALDFDKFDNKNYELAFDMLCDDDLDNEDVADFFGVELKDLRDALYENKDAKVIECWFERDMSNSYFAANIEGFNWTLYLCGEVDDRNYEESKTYSIVNRILEKYYSNLTFEEFWKMAKPSKAKSLAKMWGKVKTLGDAMIALNNSFFSNNEQINNVDFSSETEKSDSLRT